MWNIVFQRQNNESPDSDLKINKHDLGQADSLEAKSRSGIKFILMLRQGDGCVTRAIHMSEERKSEIQKRQGRLWKDKAWRSNKSMYTGQEEVQRWEFKRGGRGDEWESMYRKINGREYKYRKRNEWESNCRNRKKWISDHIKRKEWVFNYRKRMTGNLGIKKGILIFWLSSPGSLIESWHLTQIDHLSRN